MTTKLLGIIGLMLIMVSILSGKEKNPVHFPVTAIDSSLKKDAWAICREYRQEFEIINYGKAIERVHMVITVLDKNGDTWGELELPYDKSSKISSLTGRSYNSLGLPDDKLKNKAIQDLNYTSAGAIYDDLRMKTASFSGDTYPYTVEYEYIIEYNGLLDYPEWKPLPGYRIAVEKSSFQISCPDTMKFRYREFHLPQGCRTEKHENGTHTIEWKLDSLKAWRPEPMSPALNLEAPHVITAPTRFIYDGTAGSMNSWKEYGQWISMLNEGRDQLSPQRQIEIRELVKDLKDTTQIVRRLYEFMQNRTRYVGIQLGIGGFQPFPAETVDRLGYGDCKALSNYMKALLKAVGISSVYTVAGAASNLGITMTDFPTNHQSNHIILCVPLRSDTLWMECTSQTAPFGYMSPFTAGRKALNITSGEGKIVNIPLLSASQSTQNRTADVQVNPDGSIQANVKTKYSGYQFDNVSETLTESKQEQEKALYQDLSITGLVISGLSYEVNKDKIPNATESVSLSSPMFATRTGSRLFIPLNIFNQIKTAPSRVDNRRMPVYRAYAFADKDSVIMHLPKGFQPESIPKGKTFATEFGEYKSTITVMNDQLVYFRELKINRGTWPKERYSALVDFYTAIINADKVKLVLKEETK